MLKIRDEEEKQTMTFSAWIMMLSAWIFITFFSVLFFYKVLKSPHLHEHAD
jgi:glucan phosphoethanolaminetransferase (alkaline phosphatase superfamily)